MTEQQPPGWNQNESYGAETFRRMLQFIGGVGANAGNLSWPSEPAFDHPGVVLRPTALRVSQSSGMTMTIHAGAAIVCGSRSADQGGYFCYNHGAKTLALDAAPSGSNLRWDAVIARVYDTEQSEASDTWAIEKVTGTPSTSPVFPDLSAYEDIMVLAYVHSSVAGFLSVSDRRRVASLDGPHIGTLHDWAADTQPHGYLLCDGATYDVVDFPDLFSIIGPKFGGTGTIGILTTGTFVVPDLRGRTTTGPDNMGPAGSGTGDAGRLSPSDPFGTGIGAGTAQLIEANVPDHTHTITAHNAGGGAIGGIVHSGTGANDPATTGTGSGSATPFNIIQPSLSMNKIIRAY